MCWEKKHDLTDKTAVLGICTTAKQEYDKGTVSTRMMERTGTRALDQHVARMDGESAFEDANDL